MARQWVVKEKHELAQVIVCSIIGLAVVMGLLTLIAAASIR